jgi:hypothetical protein
MLSQLGTDHTTSMICVGCLIWVVMMSAYHINPLFRHEEELLAKRPTKPKPSKEYLQQKGRERSLARNQEYVLALQVGLARVQWSAPVATDCWRLALVSNTCMYHHRLWNRMVHALICVT